MSIIQGTAKGGGATSFYDYPIEQSLRFDGSSYLSRTTTTAGNQKTWTWSGWVKIIAGGRLFCTDTNTGSCTVGTNYTISFRFLKSGASEYDLITSSYYRDQSAWYHIVFRGDSTENLEEDRMKIYVNGITVNSFSTENYITPDGISPFNSITKHIIGAFVDATYPSGVAFFSGYLANMQFIDGQALDQYFFGEFKDNIWVPYNAFSTAGSGTATASDNDTATDSYGTNGFHLTFEDGIESLPVGGYTGNQNAFRDKSHNTNHWKIN